MMKLRAPTGCGLAAAGRIMHRGAEGSRMGAVQEWDTAIDTIWAAAGQDNPPDL